MTGIIRKFDTLDGARFAAKTLTNKTGVLHMFAHDDGGIGYLVSPVPHCKPQLETLTSYESRLVDALALCSARFREYQNYQEAVARDYESIGGELLADKAIHEAERNREMAELCDIAIQSRQP